GWNMLLVPLLTFGLIVAGLGVGALLSALTVAYRDFRHVVPFMVQLWMFSTPAIYTASVNAFGPRWNAVLPLNPGHGLISAFRAATLGGALDFYALIGSCAVGVLLLLAGCFYFRRVERSFADVI